MAIRDKPVYDFPHGLTRSRVASMFEVTFEGSPLGGELPPLERAGGPTKKEQLTVAR